MLRRILTTLVVAALALTTALTSAGGAAASPSNGHGRGGGHGHGQGHGHGNGDGHGHGHGNGHGHGHGPQALNVMSFNIHHAAGTDEVLSPQRIAQVIKRSGADIVGLQEVDNHYSERSDWADQAAQLGRLTGFHVAFGANIDDPAPAGSKHRIQYGTAILSRYPIVASKNTHLDGSPGEEQRGLLSTTINVRGQKVGFYTTHPSASSHDDRMSQSRQILDLIGDTDPAILVGDLNAEPDDAEVKVLTSVFTDTWAAAGRGSDGLTYPSEGPTKRIDFVLASSKVKPLSSRVLHNTPEASDHLPVLSRVLVK